MFDLSGKAAIVTGARRGIGKGIALALAEHGADVLISDIDLAGCEAACVEIAAATGRKCVPFKCDVTQKAEVEAMVARAVSEFGKLDILVNNAGIYQPSPFLELTEEDWDRTLDINLKGQFLCAQAAVPEMAKNSWGRIINIASIAAGQVGAGFASSAHYCASKGGVAAMTEALALELAPMGIRANTIGPGVIETPMTEDILADEATKQGMLARTVVGRFGKPRDIAAAAVYLASEEADFATGITLYVDGGWLAG